MPSLSRDPRRSYTPAAMQEGHVFSKRRIGGWVLAVLLVGGAVAVSLTASPASAQRKKITLDELVIEGNIQKPQAFFILPRTNLNFEDLERREDLKARIVKSVEKAPF